MSINFIPDLLLIKRTGVGRVAWSCVGDERANIARISIDEGDSNDDTYC